MLGVIVSKNLKWDEHIRKLVAKLRFRLFNLKRLSRQLPNNLLKRVADGIFMSHVRYGLSLFCPIEINSQDPHPVCIEKLRVVFNDCLRLLAGKTRSDHESIKNILEELDWLSLNQMAAESRLVEAWKTANLEDYCLKDTLKKRQKGTYATRSSNEEFFERGVDDLHGSAGFVNPTAKIWNEAPKAVKSAKRHIRNFVKELPI